MSDFFENRANFARRRGVPAFVQNPKAKNGIFVREEQGFLGSYIHGIFQSHGFRRGLLNNLRRRKGLPERVYDAPLDKEKHYDALADLVVRHSIDIKTVYRILDEGVEA